MRLKCAYHCGACHAHFKSLEAFDHHRVGDHAGERHCLNPDDVGRLTEAGIGSCDMYARVIESVVIYTSRRSQGRAREAFSGPGPEPLTPPDELPRRKAA